MDDDTHDFLTQVYNQELIALSEQAAKARHLPQPDLAAWAVNPICGSKVKIELMLKDGRVTDFGYEIEACALTKTVVAVMRKSILGKTREDIATAGATLQTMLDGGMTPVGDWADLKILAPVAAYPARYNALLLPFEAVEKAFARR